MCEIINWVIFLLLGGCSIRDCKKREIPVVLLILLGVVVLLSLFLCREKSLLARAGGAAVGLLLFLISKCTKEAIGYGDSWLILILGVYMGGVEVLEVLFVASLAAGICSLVVLWKAGWKRTTTIPFAPFLSIAYLGVMLP